MEKDLTLVILAAGMGSRFGGLKQIEPIGPNGEFIIDYSIYDAKEAGFNKVVFIIKEENYEIFKETIGKRVEDKIKVEYAFQKLDNLPEGYEVPDGRVKPWGTAHAIMCAKGHVNGNFAIINADDFYGKDAFRVIANALKNSVTGEMKKYYLVGYKVANTITSNGSVKRGICEMMGKSLTKLIESSVERKENGKILAEPLDGSTPFEVDDNTLVSMNMLGFSSDILDYIEDNFARFLDVNKDNPLKCEYLIPDVLCECIDKKIASVEVLSTVAKWYGVTYKEDKEQVVESIQKLVDDNIYPNKLWN